MNVFTNFYKKLADTSRLSEKQLHTRMKWTKRLALFSTVSALGWGTFGLAGGVALGLKAAGIHLLPAVLGASTMITGAGFAVKSFISNRILMAIHKKFEREKAVRAQNGGPATEHATAKISLSAKPAAPSLLNRLKKLGNGFNVFAKKEPAAAGKKPAPRLNRPLKPVKNSL
ncbi:MAG: hypothetical protein GC185_11455 [Alphaproteobacteria bacterium]|nr:hypothetical protein [Alphaproteobacteria bacterium]